MEKPIISVIIPCFNEEATIGACVSKAIRGIGSLAIAGEVIVVDNNSSDRSPSIAAEHGARVVGQPIQGYGAAYLKGISEAKGRYLVLGDGDDTYDFSRLDLIVRPLIQGSEMVIGSRFGGTISKGAMSFSHRYIGNPILTAILNLFYGARMSDAHSGFRAITRDALNKMNLKTTGMEFASEMIVAALREKISIKEVPIVYYPRLGESKLNSFSDAWRHLRFMLLFSPNWLFTIPGVVLFFGGLFSFILSGWGKLTLFGHLFDVHAMIFFVLFALAGSQILFLGFFARKYAQFNGLRPPDSFLDFLEKSLSLEKGLLVGSAAIVMGAAGSAYIIIKWLTTPATAHFNEIKVCLVCLLLLILGIQTIFSSFFLSLLGLRSTLSGEPNHSLHRNK